MLELKFVRENADLVRTAIANRHMDVPLDELLELDERYRACIVERDALRQERNQLSQQIGKLKQNAPEKLKEQSRSVGAKLKLIEPELAQMEERLEALALQLPNLPDPDVPLGESEHDNVVVRQSGEPADLGFQPLPHWEIGEKLGLIDFAGGVKLAGSRFYVLKGDGARLQRALISWMLDLHTREHGYTEVYPPFLVKREVMQGSGQLPKFADNLYHDEESDLWLIPTAEVPLVNLHANDILPPGSLPVNYCAFTPCFRREKAAAGRDTRGIKRVHQFDKVEMVKLCEPSQSDAELSALLSHAEDVIRRLGLTYRIVQLCTADLGIASRKTFDIEVWAAGSQEWLEVSSCSNVGDYQPRRMKLRYRSAEGAPTAYPHALNGSGVAIPRTMIAILENFQQPDGTVVVPEPLRPYFGGQERIGSAVVAI